MKSSWEAKASEEAVPVPHMRDFLSRFRPAGAPGAGRAAVPADRRRQLESELSGVLMLLDGPSAECGEIITAAQRDAEQILRAARSDAEAIVTAARERATARTAELVQEAVSAARAEASAVVTAGATEAASVRERAHRRIPGLADRAVAGLVRDLTGSGPAS